MRPARRLVTALALAGVVSVLAAVVVARVADAAPPNFVVAGDVASATGGEWGLHEAYFSELVATITNPANFGAAGIVNATFSIGAPRATPLTAGSLSGVDVYFLSAREVAPSEVAVLNAFIQQGGAVIANSNGPGFYDATSWLGFALSPRVVYGDGAAPYNTTHRAPQPSGVVSAQNAHPVVNGPFGAVLSFENWHSVAGFTGVPPEATVLARTTLTGPKDNGSSEFITLNNVATLAAIPAGTRGPGSGPIIATSDVDTFSNAYSLPGVGFPTTDALCTLTNTSNGTLARNAFAYIASQKGATTTSTTTTTLPRLRIGLVTLASPARALDTRSAIGGPATPFAAGETRDVALGAVGVPPGATLAVVNITAVDPTGGGFLSAWPSGGARPTVSSVNFVPQVTVANAAFVKIGTGGKISIYNSSGSTHVLVDVTGYVGAGGSRFAGIEPVRIKDTRTGLGGFGSAEADTTQRLTITGVPAGATAAVLNVTAVDPTQATYVTVWPADQAQPVVSNLNTTQNNNIPNLVIVRLPTAAGLANAINLFNATGRTHLLVDVLGYFTAAPPDGSVTAAPPARLMDTRPSNPIAPASVRSVATGMGGAAAVIVNVTAVDPTEAGFLTVYAGDGVRSTTSNVNFQAGRAAPNLVIVHPDANGVIQVFNSAGSTHLVVDIVGRFD